MSKMVDFIKKCKLPILWTVGYVFVVWFILELLFHFDMFSMHDWIKASNAHLHGLGGFTFCMIVFAAVPLYVATTTIVARTQKLLITLPVPNFIKTILSKLFSKPVAEPTPEQKDNEEKNESESTHPTNDELSKIPAEMRGVFIRARTRQTPICNVCSTTPNIYPTPDNEPTVPQIQPDTELPLPPDFDFDENESVSSKSSAPIFQDIDLYDEFGDSESSEDSEAFEEKDYDNIVAKHFSKTNRKFNIQPDGIIVTDTSAIAVHNDSEFWIMDEPVWFASGQTRPSPISVLLETAAKNNLQAILYLGETNIMDFTQKCKEWESNGIKVITKLEDL